MRTSKVLGNLSTLALSALLFTACSNDDTLSPVANSAYVTVAPSVSGEVITKAGSAYGQNGDKLYLYYETAGSSTANQYADFRYDGTIWDLGTHSMKWTDLVTAAGAGNPIKFYATAPIQAPTAATAIEADQSIAANYKNSDLLVAYKEVAQISEGSGSYSALAIDLKHVLAKLTIEVNAKAVENATIQSVVIKDAIAAYTVSYTGSENAPATTAVEGSDKKEIKPLVDPSGSTFTSILPAQAIQKADGINVVITVFDGSKAQTFTYQPDNAVTLLQGKNTTLKLRLAGTGVILGSVTVSDWDNGETAEDNIEADKP